MFETSGGIDVINATMRRDVGEWRQTEQRSQKRATEFLGRVNKKEDDEGGVEGLRQRFADGLRRAMVQADGGGNPDDVDLMQDEVDVAILFLGTFTKPAGEGRDKAQKDVAGVVDSLARGRTSNEAIHDKFDRLVGIIRIVRDCFASSFQDKAEAMDTSHTSARLFRAVADRK